MYPLSLIKEGNIKFFLLYLLSEDFLSSIEHYYSRARIPKINRDQLYSVEIPFPDLATQDKVVEEIEEEQALVQANHQLITRFEQKIKDRIGRVWGEE